MSTRRASCWRGRGGEGVARGGFAVLSSASPQDFSGSFRMDRRTFIATGASALGLVMLPGDALAQANSGDAALNAAFDEIFRRAVARSPELASSLGLDKGPGAALKGRLSDRTAEERERQLGLTKQALARLAAF